MCFHDMLRCSLQVLVTLTLLQLIWRNDAVPLGRSNNKKRKGTIYISKYVSAMKDAQRFVQISPERLLQTASKTRTRSASKEQKGKNKNKHRETPSRDAPQWYRRTYITATRSATRSNRSRRLRRRKRHTRINHEMLYISRTPTNERLFKAANQYNYYLRIHDDGTVDGTLLENDPRSKYNLFVLFTFRYCFIIYLTDWILFQSKDILREGYSSLEISLFRGTYVWNRILCRALNVQLHVLKLIVFSIFKGSILDHVKFFRYFLS